MIHKLISRPDLSETDRQAINFMRDHGDLLNTPFSTEAANPKAQGLTGMVQNGVSGIRSALGVYSEINTEIIGALRRNQTEIEAFSEAVDQALSNGRQVVTLGAGTSGRIGVEIARETKADRVIGRMVGEDIAIVQSNPKLEMRPEVGDETIAKLDLMVGDVLIILSSSGSPKSLHQAALKAAECGAEVYFLYHSTLTSVQELAARSDHITAVQVLSPANIVAGSTRLQSGTLTKAILLRVFEQQLVGSRMTFEAFLSVVTETIVDHPTRYQDSLAALMAELIQVAHGPDSTFRKPPSTIVDREAVGHFPFIAHDIDALTLATLLAAELPPTFKTPRVAVGAAPLTTPIMRSFSWQSGDQNTTVWNQIVGRETVAYQEDGETRAPELLQLAAQYEEMVNIFPGIDQSENPVLVIVTDPDTSSRMLSELVSRFGDRLRPIVVGDPSSFNSCLAGLTRCSPVMVPVSSCAPPLSRLLALKEVCDRLSLFMAGMGRTYGPYMVAVDTLPDLPKLRARGILIAEHLISELTGTDQSMVDNTIHHAFAARLFAVNAYMRQNQSKLPINLYPIQLVVMSVLIENKQQGKTPTEPHLPSLMDTQAVHQLLDITVRICVEQGGNLPQTSSEVGQFLQTVEV